MATMVIKGHLADVWQKRIYPAGITIVDGRIGAIEELSADEVPNGRYILPGFIDSHVHIESSMLVPAEFARLAVVHGTVATVSDPHEIANVCGLEGVEFMIENGKGVPFKFYFGAPSCVPATTFETAGASLAADEVAYLLGRPEIKYLSEMMNFPGVLHGDPEVMQKLAAAHREGKPVDGHAPGLRGEIAKAYIDAGISTDHECFTVEEALDKLKYGMKIIIREGSAAKNFEALIGLLPDYPAMMMFCSDDKHPDSLVAGHINALCARAVAKGIDLFDVLAAACVNPVLHYKLEVGLVRTGDPADLIVVEDLVDFKVLETYIDGVEVKQYAASKPVAAAVNPLNNFNCHPISEADLLVPFTVQESVPVIEALDGQLITHKLMVPTSWLANAAGTALESNVEKDVLKIAVVNRYKPSRPAVAFIRNFGLLSGALASSVAHDSHNIVAVGTDDGSLARAINLVIAKQGGVSAVSGNSSSLQQQEMLVALPVAGLMSAANGYEVAEAYTAIDKMAKTLGSSLSAPFMTLSFMALLVIPHLKLSDLGLFDGDQFKFI